MRQLAVRKEFVLMLDDDMYDFLCDKVIYENKYRAISTVIEIDEEEREKSIASIIYFLKTGHWTKGGVDGVHPKDRNRYNLQFDNLELHPWTSIQDNKTVARGNTKEGKVIAFK